MSGEEDILLLAQCIAELPGLERKLLALYYLENMSLADIAAGFDLSEKRSCQILVGSIDLLQRRFRRIRRIANQETVASRSKAPQKLLLKRAVLPH